MRVVVTGGGTGGHVYPALAVAGYLSGADSSWETLFIGTESGPEAAAARVAGIPFEGLELAGLMGRRPGDRIRALTLFTRGVWSCRRILGEFQPGCVVGTGGYVAAPACFAARTLGIPIILHEMNYHPGVVTRVLSRGAYAVAVAHRETGELLPRNARVVTTGIPVRPEIEALASPDRRREAVDEACERFGLELERRTLLLFGGSQGAEALNEALWEVLPRVSGRGDLQVLHLTGKKGYEKRRRLKAEESLAGKPIIYRPIAYLERMDLAYAVCDLAVARAGAGTVAELMAASLPSVLVPFPYATGAHQESNARSVERLGAARVVKQRGDSALDAVEEAGKVLAKWETSG